MFLRGGVINPLLNPYQEDQGIPFCLGHLWPIWHGRPYQ